MNLSFDWKSKSFKICAAHRKNKGKIGRGYWLSASIIFFRTLTFIIVNHRGALGSVKLLLSVTVTEN